MSVAEAGLSPSVDNGASEGTAVLSLSCRGDQ